MAGIRVVLVGLGGYAGSYAALLLRPDRPAGVEFCAAVDPYASKAAAYARVRALGIPVYDTLEQCFARHRAELVIISTPVHLHQQQVMAALQNGAHVLCEKPLAPTVQAVKALAQAAGQAGRMLAVGFQWSFSDPILHLKRDILRGDFGRPICLKAMVGPGRPRSYYQGWQGHLRAPDGQWLLDSIATNAASHSLHNLLFLLGSREDAAANVKSGQAALYRGNAIEGFDACFIHAVTQQGVPVALYAAHTVERDYPPQFDLRFEHARIILAPQGEQAQITARLDGGRTRVYGDPQQGAQRARKLYRVIQAIADGGGIPCSAHTVSAHIALCNALFDQVPIVTLPDAHLACDAQRDLVFVPGMADTLQRCYQAHALPTMLGAAWAVPETPFTLENYHAFDGRLLGVQP